MILCVDFIKIESGNIKFNFTIFNRLISFTQILCGVFYELLIF